VAVAVKKLLLAGIAAAVLCGAHVHAGTPLFNWSGFYAGANAGYGWGDPPISVFSIPAVSAPPALPATYHPSFSGFIGGGQAGYNYQFTNTILGIETDISYSHIRSSTAVSGIIPPSGLRGIPTPFSYMNNHQLDWFGTLRGRLGFLMANTSLIYATGGLAFGGVKASATLNDLLAGVGFVGSASSTKAGWTVGGGGEAVVANRWTAKLEYLYYDLGKLKVIGSPPPATSPLLIESDFATRGHIIRAGLNYKFE
jgi:outer membrane immunogenic protein